MLSILALWQVIKTKFAMPKDFAGVIVGNYVTYS